RLVVVQLQHLPLLRRRRVDAEAAQDALVDVALHDLDATAVVAVDVDRADLAELRGDGGVVDDRVGDLDPDERSVDSHATLLSASLAFMISGISEISSATVIPASANRLIFSVAVSSLPSTIVPAWPNDIPGISSMNRPAMNATIGRRELFSVTHRA